MDSDLFSVRGRTALVTGGATGLGISAEAIRDMAVQIQEVRELGVQVVVVVGDPLGDPLVDPVVGTAGRANAAVLRDAAWVGGTAAGPTGWVAR